MIVDKKLLDALTARACESPRLRMNYDLRTTTGDGSQRMLNAIEPESELPIHRHMKSTECVAVIRGRGIQYCYDDLGNVVDEVLLEAGGPTPMMSVEVGTWHRFKSLESGTVIFEAKDGAYEALREEEILKL